MHRHRILLLEDEPELADLLVELMSEFTHEVKWAASMADALGILEDEYAPCAIIADLTLPDVGRNDVVRLLRDKSGSASIVLMSAISARDLQRLGQQEGVQGVIPKPFDLDQFERAVVFGCGEGDQPEAP